MKRATAFAVALVCTILARAEPFVPARDDEVLQRVPVRLSREVIELRVLRARLDERPDDLLTAELLARRAIEVGRAELDPRYFGYAEAALRSWLTLPTPPTEIVVLGAIVDQSRHDFDMALLRLDTVLARDPRNAQAYLTSATVLQTQGKHQRAMERCGSLLLLPGSQTLATICLAKSLGMTGRADVADRMLASLLEASTHATPRERLWALTVLAESLARRDLRADASRRFDEALALGLRDVYLLSAYADWLLDCDAADRVQALLAEEALIDGLLLRLTIAERRLGISVERRVTSLEGRFDANRRRGGAVHFRDEARFALEILDDAPRALLLAAENWRGQREPRDARLLLETALAAGDREAARPAIEAVRASALEDARIADLIARLERGR